MKIRIDNFKGRIPKLSDRALPINNSVIAKNCRLLSGDLEPWNDVSMVQTLNKPATTTSIYPMDRQGASGGPYWLNWNSTDTNTDFNEISITKGAIFSDTNETTYYTGAKDNSGSLFRPKVTNLSLAKTTPVKSTGYPYDWRILGVPPPTGALTATSTLTGVSYTDVSSNLNDWTTQTFPNSSVTVSTSIGTPAPCFDLKVTGASGGPFNSALVYKNLNLLGGYGSLKFDIRSSTTSGTVQARDMRMIFGADSSGNGGVGISLAINGGVSITKNTVSWNLLGPQIGSVSGTLFSPNQFYTCEIIYSPSDGTLSVYDLTINITGGALTPITINLAKVKISGQYFGTILLSAASGTDVDDIYLDSVQVKTLIVLNDPSYEATSYVYTYKTDLGFEGPQNNSSNIVWIGPNLSTVVTGFINPGTNDYGINKIELYRAATGSNGTQYQFMVELPLTTTTYTDTLLDTALGEVLVTSEYDLPPTDGHHIVTMPNGITVMASGNTICPSVQYIPYAYPQSYRLATEFPVVSLQALETTLVALTQDSAYLIVGSDPSALSMSKITPVYGCVSSKSSVRWNLTNSQYVGGITYASKDGLVLVNSYGAQLITRDFISPREWQSNYNPSTIIGTVYQDMYFGIYTNSLGVKSAFMFDPRENGLGFIDIDITANAVYTNHYDEIMYVVNGNTLNTWNTGSPLTFQWKSRLFQLPYPITFSCGQIRAYNSEAFTSNVTLNIYKDNLSTPYFTKSINKSIEFVTPDNVLFDVAIELIGNGRVNTIELAEDIMELE